jgi:lipoate---protein ligase
MFFIDLDTHDPFFNLAVEEVLLKKSSEDYLILGINSRSLIIGKHQSAHREVNTEFVTENNIPVIRRISGGGTVFHDEGNLNFTFIKEAASGKQVDFPRYTRPVIEFLLSLGVDARFEGKNDIKVEGFKISGNAEHVHGNRVLHHGTLLFSTSAGMIKSSIRSDKSCYFTRAVDSNPSPVMNLEEKLGRFHDISGFREELKNYLLDKMPGTEVSCLSRSQQEEAAVLAETKYKSWEWNFAYGPEYTFRNNFRFDGKIISCDLFVRDGIVKSCSVTGSDRLLPLAQKLEGCRHMVSDFLTVFKSENIADPEAEIFNFF